MNHLPESFALLFAYTLGVSLALWAKVNDLNNMKEELDVWKAFKLFMRKELKAYGSAMTIGLLFSFFHDECIGAIAASGVVPDKLMQASGAAPMITSFLLGLVIQYVGYKYIFGRLEKLFKGDFVKEREEMRKEIETLKNILKQ